MGGDGGSRGVDADHPCRTRKKINFMVSVSGMEQMGSPMDFRTSDYKNSPAEHEERAILRELFESVTAIKDLDNTISDSKFVKAAVRDLKTALRGVKDRCTCAKRTWGGPCELCQASDEELYSLRNFYRTVRKAKDYDMNKTQLQEIVENIKKRVNS